jgi:hypothetical protein
MKINRFLILFVLIICNISAIAQDGKEIVVKTEVSEATVFINGAQVLRKKVVDLPAGKSKIRFTNLSPYIDAKSVQIKAAGDVMVTSVNHQMNYLDSTVQQSTKINTLLKQKEDLSDKIALENTNRDVIKEELNFLNENKKIGGSNNGVSLVTLRETANFYKERISALKIKDMELVKKIQTLTSDMNAVQNEINQLVGKNTKKTPIGEVLVEVDCPRLTKANMELTYYVDNAGWYPSYDIRATNIDQPIELIYKANIRQNTQEDWKNIKLKVSSSDPNLGNVAPELKTYYLNYYTAAPRYNTQPENNQVSGIVLDSGNEPLIGVSVVVKGTTIGTATDLNGRFSLAIPQIGNTLDFSYVGFERKSVPVSNSFMTVVMEESMAMLDEVVVIGYGTKASKSMTGAVAGVSVNKAVEKKVAAPEIKRMDIAMPTTQIENQTAVEFEIKVPYTIKSGNKNTLIEVDRYMLPADYEYYTVPKVNKEAFLLANIADWEKYNLLDGEANIFFENTYIGKTILDIRRVDDTLNISLGRDKNVLVSREKVKDYNTKKFLGNKKEDVRAWKISVKNNKNQPINLVVLDQVPVSTNMEIEVSTEELSGAEMDSETGEVKWKMNLKPSDKKDMQLRYKVKYPKNKNLTVE